MNLDDSSRSVIIFLKIPRDFGQSFFSPLVKFMVTPKSILYKGASTLIKGDINHEIGVIFDCKCTGLLCKCCANIICSQNLLKSDGPKSASCVTLKYN